MVFRYLDITTLEFPNFSGRDFSLGGRDFGLTSAHNIRSLAEHSNFRRNKNVGAKLRLFTKKIFQS